jgi:ribosomal protein L11 methyltransferase
MRMPTRKVTPAARPPARDLHIYCVHGRLPDRCDDLGPGHIGNWEEDGSAFLFFSRPSDGIVRRLVADHPRLSLVDTHRMGYEEWQGGPLRAAMVGRFRIVPPWQAAGQNTPSADTIWIDPGVVFGAGNHATTRDSLLALHRLLGRQDVDTVLDLGTGTGLLAVFAAKMGCRRVLAVDLNRLAVRTAVGNIALNGLQDKVLAIQGRAEEHIDTPADLVVANIHYAVMAELIENAGFGRKKWFLLSGMMRREAKQIAQRLAETGADILQSWSDDGIWFTFLGKTG